MKPNYFASQPTAKESPRSRKKNRPGNGQDHGETVEVQDNPALSVADQASDASSKLLTEDALALKFADRYRDELRYCHHTGAWFKWDKLAWRREETRLAFHYARLICRQHATKGKTFATFRKAVAAKAVEQFAQSDRAFAVTSEIWDRDPFMLGTPGGTVDLRTGEIHPARPSDFISKLTTVAPADTPECPPWLEFLGDATRHDHEMIRFLRQWCGYCLTGDIREHALLFIFGPGGNGKSVFLNVITGIMGEYCCVAAMDTFTAAVGNRHPTDLARLKGARLVTASETEEGRAWAEVRINQVTGGDKIAARFMKQDFFEFKPQFKLTGIANHKPVLRNVNDALRRRIRLAPFIHKPPAVNKALEAELRTEWPGILRWMIEGCLDWQMHGLIQPAVVTQATEAYFQEQDTFRQWIGDRCEEGADKSDTFASLFGSWRIYAVQQGEEPASAKRFSAALQRSDYEPFRNTEGRSCWRGLKVTLYHELYEP
jgi:putative DNA primase/helicase